MPLTLLGRSNPLASAAEQLRILDQPSSSPPFALRLTQAGMFPLRASGITVFQINVGKLCNQTCRHCHVDAGPDRPETMSLETAEHCMRGSGQDGHSHSGYHRWRAGAESPFSLARRTVPRTWPACDGSLQSVRVAASFPGGSRGIPGSPPGGNHRLASVVPCQPDRCTTRRRHF